MKRLQEERGMSKQGPEDFRLPQDNYNSGSVLFSIVYNTERET